MPQKWRRRCDVSGSGDARRGLRELPKAGEGHWPEIAKGAAEVSSAGPQPLRHRYGELFQGQLIAALW